MTVLWVMLIIGIIVFPIGCYRFLKDQKTPKSLQIFGGISFIGLALIVSSLGLLALYHFPTIDKNIILVMMGAAFVIGSIVFLRPGFHDKW